MRRALELRVLTALLLVAIFLVDLPTMSTASASIDCDEEANLQLRECAARAREAALTISVRQVDLGHVVGGEQRGSGGGVSQCTVEAVSDDWVRTYQQAHVQDDAPDEAVFYWLSCPNRSGLRWYVPDEGEAGPDFVEELVQEAFDQIHAVAPTLVTSPPVDRAHLVGLPTWLAVDAGPWDDPVVGVAATSDVTVTAWLEPVEVTYEVGTGDRVVCGGPGNRYDPELAHHLQTPQCSYTYTHTPAHLTGDAEVETYRLTATITYLPHYRVTTSAGADATATLTLIDGPSAVTDLVVQELRAVRTTNP